MSPSRYIRLIMVTYLVSLISLYRWTLLGQSTKNKKKYTYLHIPHHLWKNLRLLIPAQYRDIEMYTVFFLLFLWAKWNCVCPSYTIFHIQIYVSLFLEVLCLVVLCCRNLFSKKQASKGIDINGTQVNSLCPGYNVIYMIIFRFYCLEVPYTG